MLELLLLGVGYQQVGIVGPRFFRHLELLLSTRVRLHERPFQLPRARVALLDPVVQTLKLGLTLDQRCAHFIKPCSILAKLASLDFEAVELVLQPPQLLLVDIPHFFKVLPVRLLLLEQLRHLLL